MSGYAQFLPYLLALLAVLLVYRRLRRSFGRQRVQPVRMGLRIVLLTVVGLSLLPAAARSSASLVAEPCGLALGLILGWWGARQTRYQRDDGRLYFVPHTYTGLAVSALLIGRLVFRVVEWRSQGPSGVPGSAPMPEAFAPGMMTRSPLTVGMLFVVIGYYVCYYGLVLWKSKHLQPHDLELAASTP